MSYRSFTDCMIYRHMEKSFLGTRSGIINGRFMNKLRNSFNGRCVKRFMNRCKKRIMNRFIERNIDAISLRGDRGVNVGNSAFLNEKAVTDLYIL